MSILDRLPWRSVPEQKLDYTEALLLPLQLSGPSFNRSYSQAIANSYELNSIAHRAIRLIAENMSSVPWVLYQGEEHVDRHWVLDTLRKPNLMQSGRIFKQTLAGDLVAAGEVFVLKIQPRAEAPAELHLLRPDHVKINPSTVLGEPPTYEYAPPGGRPSIYTRDEVLHIHTLDLLRSGRGFSSIYAAASDLDQSNLGGKWNVSLLQNGGRPSIAVIAKSRLSTEQKQMLRDSVENMHSGAGNAGRVAVFSGSEIEIRDLGFSPKDMDWKDGINEVNARIATALGVPPEMLNLGEGTYENKSAAKRSLYEDVIVPLFGLVTESLNEWMVPEGFELRGYWEKVEALQPNRTEEYGRLDKAVQAGWLTINDARREAGFDPDIVVGDLYRWQADAIAQFGNVSLEQDATSLASSQDAYGTKTRLETETEKVIFWKRQDRRREAFEKMLEKQLVEHFEKEGKRFQDKLETLIFPEDIYDVIDTLVDEEELKQILETAYLAVMEDFGEAVLRDIGVKQEKSQTNFDMVFGTYTSQVYNFIETNTAEQVTNVTQTTKKAIRSRVRKGIESGSGIPAIAEDINGLYYGKFGMNRSTVIARTEVIRASNAGSFHAAQGTGLPVVKSWIAVRDDRARQAHLAAELDPRNIDIPVDTYFVVGGEQLMTPGDPSGSPGNTIQCRCTVAYDVRAEDLAVGAPDQDILPDVPAAPKPTPKPTPSVPPTPPAPSVPATTEVLNEAELTQRLTDRFDRGRIAENYRKTEVKALDTYSGYSYRRINTPLRTGEVPEPDVAKAISQMDKALGNEYSRMGSNGVLYRGYKMNVDDVPDDVGMMIGEVLEDRAYMSTSISRDIANRFAGTGAPQVDKLPVIVRINATENTRGIYLQKISQHAEEKEFLLPRGTSLEVVSAEKKTRFGFPYIELEAIITGGGG